MKLDPVLFVTDSVSRAAGGLFPAVRSLAEALHRNQGLSMHVFAHKDRDTVTDLSRWTAVRPRVFDRCGIPPLWFNIDIIRAADNLNPCIVHTHSLWKFPSVVAAKWSRKGRKPYVVSPHGALDPWALRHSRWKKLIAEAVYEKKHLSMARCIHALCAAEAEAIRRYGLTNPICIIPNGVDLSIVNESGEAPWQSLVPAEKRVLLFLSRIHPKKGMDPLLRAWALCLRADARAKRDWCLVIAGWGNPEHERALRRMIAELELGDSVVFVGPQFDEAKAGTYSRADAFILPSFSEGLPMVILEAWANRLPVLMSRECNLPEGLARNAALEIKPYADQLARSLSGFFEMSEAERNEMGENGRTLVEDKFVWPNISAEMTAVYKWLVVGGEAPQSIFTE